MPPCIECTQLWNLYTNLRLKYRIALAALAGRIADDDLKKLRDAGEVAQRTLKEHEVTHAARHQVIATEASLAADMRDNRTRAILLPPVQAREPLR